MNIVTYGLGGYDETKPNNNVISVESVQVLPSPLNPEGVFATLNVILGLWSIEDASNAIRVAPENLIHEAESWAAAASFRQPNP